MSDISSGRLLPEISSNLPVGPSNARDRVLSYYEDFQAKLKELMLTLTTDDKPLELDGFKIPADQKNGAAATYLINNWLSENDFILSQLLDAYKFEQTLEQKLNNVVFS